MTNFKTVVDDLRTWLSYALTYQETCLDGFVDTITDAAHKMRKALNSSQELTDGEHPGHRGRVLRDARQPGPAGLPPRAALGQGRRRAVVDVRRQAPAAAGLPRCAGLQAGRDSGCGRQRRLQDHQRGIGQGAAQERCHVRDVHEGQHIPGVRVRAPERDEPGGDRRWRHQDGGDDGQQEKVSTGSGTYHVQDGMSDVQEKGNTVHAESNRDTYPAGGPKVLKNV
ncbi:hypothetical protein PVAP13_2NG203058 [Panicum virgatum]|uniref:Pectinesterase inhibitor domain-containing protein n=1 Tax=Panicum virgatum TaxID=38727 RepID=A0A8T0VAF9_PANVG|nr:hypothetical protein PVAP13_2NG203058 [Panicum virgatum]